MTTAKQIILHALARGPQSRSQLEAALQAAHYQPSGAAMYLAQLKRGGRIRHVQRGNRGRPGLYALSEN